MTMPRCLYLPFALAAIFRLSAATPAELAIHAAQADIQKEPTFAPYYNQLALAYSQRARETSDYTYFAKADDALSQSLKLAPDNYDGLKVKVWTLLGRDEFEKALDVAAKLNKQTPDDVIIYGYMADAHFELGNYDAAVQQVQWMLNLRVGNAPGMARAAYLREVHGDLEGALDAARVAFDVTPTQQTDDRAALLTQIARIHWLSGDFAKAESIAEAALKLQDGNYQALGVLGQIRMSQKRYADAVAFLDRRYRAAPHPENLYPLAEAQQLAGLHAEAQKNFAEFERQALEESARADNANRELIAYYVDYAQAPAKALKLAEREIVRRHDVCTLDAYAWALAATGDYARANQEIAKATSLGVKEPKILEHAALIAKHLEAIKPAAQLR